MSIVLNKKKCFPILSESKSVHEVGLKAYRLSELVRLGYRVPCGCIITPDIFWKVVYENNKEEPFRQLLKQERCLAWKEIKELIKNLVVSEEIKAEIEEKSNLVGWPIAIRSSGVDEDGNNSSKAGVYDSIVGCKDLVEVVHAIKECWCTSFSPLAQAFGGGEEPIPLILQRTVKQDYSGVAFSVDPLSGDDSLIVICGVKDGGDGIVSGKMSGSVRVLSKDNLNVIEGRSEGEFPIKIAKEIAGILVSVKNSLNIGEVDMEWAVSGNDLYILQARPVTSVAIKNSDRSTQIYDLDSDDCFEAPLDKLHELHSHWFEKQYWFRKIANEHGIRIPKACYLKYDPSLITREEVETMFREYMTPYLVIDRSAEQRTLFLRKEDLLDVLKSFEPSEDGVLTVRIRELADFQISGFSSCLPDGRILVESFPGAFTGVYKYDVIPSNYILNMKGDILGSNIRNYDKCCRLNETNCKFKEFYEEGLSAEINKDVLDEIVRMSIIMTKELVEPRLEWTFSKNEVFLVDLSLEHQPLTIVDENTRVLSNGNFQGEVVKFPDVSVLKSVCSTHTISVVPEPQFFAARDYIKKSEHMSNIVKANKKVVVVAKQPVTELALIMDSVAGFIFEEGSLLCHLGIILREAHIPAVFLDNALLAIEDGANLMCFDGKVKIG